MKLAMRVKVCGLNNKSDLLTMSKLKVDFFGFIFYKKSPRYFFDYPLDIDKDLNSVVVFVNESLKKFHFENKNFYVLGNFIDGISVSDCIKKAKKLVSKLWAKKARTIFIEK